MKLKKLTIIACLFAVTMTSSTVMGQDLFNKQNKGGLSSAFTKPKTSSHLDLSTSYSTEKLDKYIASREFVKSQKMKSGAGHMVTYKYKSWTFPMDISLSKSGTNLWVIYYLKTVEKEININECANELVKLMDANGAYGDYYFRYNPKTRQITLAGAIQVRGQLPDEEIDKQLEKMSKIAVATKDLWNTKSWTDAPKYVGAWKSQNMTLKLSRTGTFELKTNTSTSTGSFKIEEGKMLMTEKSGEKINGSIQFDGPNNFEFNVNGTQMKFVRM